MSADPQMPGPGTEYGPPGSYGPPGPASSPPPQGWPAPPAWSATSFLPPGPPRRGLPAGAKVAIAAVLGIVGLFGMLIVAVLFLGTSSEAKFVPVGEAIDRPSGLSGSSGSSFSGPTTTIPEAGLLLSEDDLTDQLGVDAGNTVLEESQDDGPGESRSFCDERKIETAGKVSERWVGSAWLIDVSVIDYGSEDAAQSTIEEKQVPAFRDCLANRYSAGSPFGALEGEVVDQDETTTGEVLTVSGVVDGHSDGCETRMAVAYRQVRSSVASVRLFVCTDEFGERSGAPALDLDAADRLAETLADRVHD